MCVLQVGTCCYKDTSNTPLYKYNTTAARLCSYSIDCRTTVLGHLLYFPIPVYVGRARGVRGERKHQANTHLSLILVGGVEYTQRYGLEHPIPSRGYAPGM